jgi:hypothetical protein
MGESQATLTRATGSRLPALVYAFLWLAAIVTPIYWVVYFATGNLTPSPTDVGQRFELAFPAADMWMAIAAALGAIGLQRGARWGRAMAIAAGSAMLYLALMDITFDLENGVYFLIRGQVIVEMIINATCVIGSLYLLYELIVRAPRT